MTKSETRTCVRFASILLVLLLLLSVVPFTALASSTNTDKDNVSKFVLTGTFEGKFELSSKDKTLFHLEDIAPGDKWNGKIEIQNKASGRMAISLLAITSDIQELALFNALYLDISYEGKSIYSGSYNTGKSPVTDSFVVEPNSNLTFDVTVILPRDAGNEVASKRMDSTWTFEAMYTEKPKTGVDLASENTSDLFALWVLLFAALGAAIIVLRIRSAVKAQKAIQSQDVPNDPSKEVNES